MTKLEELFAEAMSWAAVWGSVMPTDIWDSAREKRAQEYAAKAEALRNPEPPK